MCRPRAGRRGPRPAAPGARSARRSAPSSPLARMRSTRAKTCCTMTGARPAEGSSSNRSRGCDIRARPIAHICCSPPDIVPANCRRRSCRRGKQLVDKGEALAEFRAGARNERADAQIVLDPHARKQAAVFRHMGDAQFDDAMRRGGHRSTPSNRDRAPASAGSAPRSPASRSSCRRRWDRSPPRLHRDEPRARPRTAPESPP